MNKLKSENQIKAGVLLSYLQMVANVLIQLLYTPVMIRLLGRSEYGLYNTVASAISILSVLSMGFTSGYVRFFSIYNQDEDRESTFKLNGIYLLVLSIISVICLVIGTYISFHLEIVFKNGLTSAEYTTARVLALILTTNLALTFVMSVFQHIVSAHERFVFLKSVGLIRNVLAPFLTLPVLLLGYKSVGMALVTTFVSFLADCMFFLYVKRVMHEKFIFHDLDFTLIKSIFAFTFFIALNLIVEQINWSIDKVLLGRYKGTSEVALYAAAFTIYQCYMIFSTSISNVFIPRVHRIVNESNDNSAVQKTRLTELFVKVGRIQFLVLALVASGYLFFGKYFITHIWIGQEYLGAYTVSLFLLLPASIALIQNIGIEIQRAENKHKFRSIVYFFMALLNLTVSLALCKKYGAVGCAFGTCLSLIVANGLIMNVYYHKKCNVDILAFWKNIIRMLPGIIAPALLGILINHIGIHSTWIFLGLIVLYCMVYAASMWLLAMNESEKALLTKPIKRLLKGKT